MNADRGVQMEKSNGSHQAETHRPTHGFTRAGHPVHGKVIDHLPSGTGYERFNKKVAIWLVKNVGTMTCFWVFLFIAFLSLPATLVLATVFKAPTHTVVITFALSYGFIFLIDWLCQNVIQLILLPGLMVGQNLQNEASDARSTKQFEDTEMIADRLDIHTQGGITDLLEAIDKLRDDLLKRISTGPRTEPPSSAENDQGQGSS